MLGGGKWISQRVKHAYLPDMPYKFDLEATSFNQTIYRRAGCAGAPCYLRMSSYAYIMSYYAYQDTDLKFNFLNLDLALYLICISL